MTITGQWGGSVGVSQLVNVSYWVYHSYVFIYCPQVSHALLFQALRMGPSITLVVILLHIMTMEQQLLISVTLAIIEQVETVRGPVLLMVTLLVVSGMELLLNVYVCYMIVIRHIHVT